MNKPLAIGLGVAGVAVIGGIGFALLRKPAAAAKPSLPAPPPAPRLDQGAPQAPRTDIQASTSYKFVDRKGVPQAAADLGELRNRLLAEWGNEASARLAPTIFPGESEWRPAGFRVFPLFKGNAFDASNIKSLGRMPSGYGVPAKYAAAAGLAYDAALERMNGRGGAQMVNGRG